MNFLSDTDNSSCQSLLDLVSELDADPFNAAQEDIPWTQYVSLAILTFHHSDLLYSLYLKVRV